jgi:hypothetical protein
MSGISTVPIGPLSVRWRSFHLVPSESLFGSWIKRECNQHPMQTTSIERKPEENLRCHRQPLRIDPSKMPNPDLSRCSALGAQVETGLVNGLRC